MEKKIENLVRMIGVADVHEHLSIRRLHTLLVVHQANEWIDYGAVAKEMGVSKPALTRAVYALQDAGLLFVRDDPNDRRKTILKTTAAGNRAVLRVIGEPRTVERQVA